VVLKGVYRTLVCVIIQLRFYDVELPVDFERAGITSFFQRRLVFFSIVTFLVTKSEECSVLNLRVT
jgi:hypothetical protein